MKFKQCIPSLVIFIIGFMIILMGALFKVLHWGLGPVSASYLLALGTFIVLIALLVLIITLLVIFFKKQRYFLFFHSISFSFSNFSITIESI
jgi:hypothetical protein